MNPFQKIKEIQTALDALAESLIPKDHWNPRCAHWNPRCAHWNPRCAGYSAEQCSDDNTRPDGWGCARCDALRALGRAKVGL